MSIQEGLTSCSCWVVSEGLMSLQNQAIGLAQALKVNCKLKVLHQLSISQRFFSSPLKNFNPPWPEVLITCGRQSVEVSRAIRLASQGKTFTIHIQNPLIDPRHFDVVVVPAHDSIRGDNVFVTQGAVNHVTEENLKAAAEVFRSLLGHLRRPLVSVLVGGKNEHQNFTPSLADDFAHKLLKVQQSGCGLAVSFSRRTGEIAEAILRKALLGSSCYIWDGKKENPYLGFLSLADFIIVTSDSISMLSEACSTGKPVYIYGSSGITVDKDPASHNKTRSQSDSLQTL